MGFVVCVMVLALGIGTLIGAVILRAAVSLCNKITGGARANAEVPEPSFGQAALIAFLSILVNFGVQFVLGFIVGGSAAAGGGGEQAAMAAAEKYNIAIQIVGHLASLLAIAGFSTAMLPTTFPRGLLVALCYVLVSLVVIICIVGIVLVSMKVIGR